MQILTHAKNMFKGLSNIVEIDLSEFDSSKVTNMAHMFNGCSGFEKIKFGEMQTSQVQNMEYLFCGCKKLESLDLSKFSTSNVKSMAYMFSNTKKLKSLDISNFDTSKVETIENMFSNCDNLHYLNIEKFKIEDPVNKDNAFEGKNDFLKICITNEATINYLIDLSDRDKIICHETCLDQNKKYFDKTNMKCVDKCDKRLYIYDIFCYDKCPEATTEQQVEECSFKKCKTKNICVDSDVVNNECYESCQYCTSTGTKEENNCKECKQGYKFLDDTESIKNNCYQICPIYYYFDENSQYNCIEKCSEKYSKTILPKMKCIEKCSKDNKYKYEFNDLCLDNCPEGTIYNTTSEICEVIKTDNDELNSNDVIAVNLQESITGGSFNNIIENIIKEEKDYTISNEKTLYQITTSDNQKNKSNNVSTIDFGDCEETLKRIYDIDMSIPLIIFKVDYFNPETLIPIIGYEVYHPLNKSKLNLSYCNNTVNLNIPVQIDENKIYKYDPNSDYYVDQCSSYTSDNGTDILLSDRQKEYSENNLSLCEANCDFQGYETNSKQSICNCKIKNNIEYKTDISNNPNALSQPFNTSETDLGYTNVFACTKNLFTVNGILKNMSSYILIISLLFFVATSLFFRRRGYHILVNHMNNIINEKMKFQTHLSKNNHRRNDSNKLSKFKNNEKFNFPPKKISKRQKSIYSLNSNKKLKDQKSISKLKGNISKKEYSVKIVDSSLRKINENDNNDNIDTHDFPSCEMNLFNYSEAISYDKRTYFQYYISLIKTKQPVLFAFCPNDDYNSRLIKIGIFILSFNIHYATNFAYFLNEKIIHEIFEKNGKYDIIFFLPYIIITFIISHALTIIIKLILLSDSNIIELKRHKNLMQAQNSLSSIRRKLIIKYIIFYIIGILFHLFFWLALSSFSTMYTNTQVFVLENALIAYGISLIYPFIFNIIPCVLRICSLKGEEKSHSIMFNISKVLQVL